METCICQFYISQEKNYNASCKKNCTVCQGLYVRGQLFLQIFVWFFVAESLSEWVFSILKQQDRNETAFIS